MCIYPDGDKRVDSQFVASSVWHTDLYVYPTFKIYSTVTIAVSVLVFVGEALLLFRDMMTTQLYGVQLTQLNSCLDNF